MHRPLTPIAPWKILVGAAVVIVVTTAAVVVLWWAGTRGLEGKDLVSARLDVLKIGLSIAVGSGGVAALYLGWRRQRSTEADLDNRERALTHQQHVAAVAEAHQSQVAVDARLDARERRITELYTKAVDQLGSDKPAVRMGGLYALERLAQNNVDQRQTIVNVLCAYLRMPITVQPTGGPHSENTTNRPPTNLNLASAALDSDTATQEREVRLTAERILTAHLKFGPPSDAADTTPEPTPDSHWADIDIDLTGAALLDCDFTNSRFRAANFTGSKFQNVDFTRAQFSGDATFTRAQFGGNATFTEAQFGRNATFGEAQFSDAAWFTETRFSSTVRFGEARFSNDATFIKVVFGDAAWFTEAQFSGTTRFDGARFNDDATFIKVRFSRIVFSEAQVSGIAGFSEAQFSGDAQFNGVEFGSTNFSRAQFMGNADFRKARFRGNARFGEVRFSGNRYLGRSTSPPWTNFQDARFGQAISSELTRFIDPRPSADKNQDRSDHDQ